MAVPVVAAAAAGRVALLAGRVIPAISRVAGRLGRFGQATYRGQRLVGEPDSEQSPQLIQRESSGSAFGTGVLVGGAAVAGGVALADALDNDAPALQAVAAAPSQPDPAAAPAGPDASNSGISPPADSALVSVDYPDPAAGRTEAPTSSIERMDVILAPSTRPVTTWKPYESGTPTVWESRLGPAPTASEQHQVAIDNPSDPINGPRALRAQTATATGVAPSGTATSAPVMAA